MAHVEFPVACWLCQCTCDCYLCLYTYRDDHPRANPLAFMALIMGFGPLFYILWEFR